MLNLQHQHNNHTITPHLRVGPSVWGPPLYEGLLCDCCDDVVYESNPKKYNPKAIVNNNYKINPIIDCNCCGVEIKGLSHEYGQW